METAPYNTDPLARELLAALEKEFRAKARGAYPTTEQARRIATRIGHGMLAASHQETAKHCDQVVVISRSLCPVLGIQGHERQDLLAAARLHDLGKVAMPDALLEKAGPLNAKEWGQMRTHTIAGSEILEAVPELAGVAKLVRSSHERWDGAGYPDGLRGEQIPLGSRVIFCADAFDAIQSDRPYRKGRSGAEALEEIRRNSGSQFDPAIVDALEAA